MKIEINEEFNLTNYSKEICADSSILEFQNFKKLTDIKKSKHSINCLNVINLSNKANTIYKNLGITKRIDYSIVFEVMTAIWEEDIFKEEQYDKLLSLYSEIALFLESIEEEDNDNFYLRPEVELLLFGFNINHSHTKEKTEKFTDLCYEKLSDYSNKKITFNEAKNQITKILIKNKAGSNKIQ